MKKCVYYGPAVDFWWLSRFKEGMKNLKDVEFLSEGSISLETPLIFYSHRHDVTIRYKMENTIYPGEVNRNTPLIRRTRVTLYGKEDDIKDLEILIRGEAGRLRGIDIIER